MTYLTLPFRKDHEAGLSEDQRRKSPGARVPFRFRNVITMNGSRISVESTASQPSDNPINWRQYVRGISPLLSGGLGPISLLMALCGCIDTWRAIIRQDGSQLNETDPLWVVIPTWIAFAVGLVANLFLLAKLLEWSHSHFILLYSVMFWVFECIHLPLCLCVLILAVINFTTIAVYVRKIGDDGEWTYAQGFWMTVCSAAMSTLCAILLLLYPRTPDGITNSRQKFLSPRQRQFIIYIMIFIIWLAMYLLNFGKH